MCLALKLVVLVVWFKLRLQGMRCKMGLDIYMDWMKAQSLGFRFVPQRTCGGF